MFFLFYMTKWNIHWEIYMIFWFTEKGIAGHEIDLANKKVRVTSNTLDSKEVEDILKKTGLSTSFVGEKEA